MPNGPESPLAKTSFMVGASAPSAVRITRIRSSRVSAMKTSPLGAVRMSLGPDRPVTNGFTVNPGRTDREAPSGRSTSFGPLPADVVA
jgi:hypothetical protein